MQDTNVETPSGSSHWPCGWHWRAPNMTLTLVLEGTPVTVMLTMPDTAAVSEMSYYSYELEHTNTITHWTAASARWQSQ